VKILHAADLHLDSPLGGLEFYEGAPVDEVRSATRRALVNLVDYCLGERVELLLLAGDLYDGDWRDYSTGLFFLQQMARLADGPTRVVWVRGNHDAQSQITRHLSPPGHVRELSVSEPESAVFDDLGIVVHGRGYAVRDTKDNLVTDYPARIPGLLNLGLLHTAVDGREPHARYAPCTLDQLRACSYDYFALGHVHAREVLSTDPWVVFPGNLQGRHVRECGPKGATVIEVRDGRILSVEHVDFDVVRWHVAQVSSGPDDGFEAAREKTVMALEAAKIAAKGRVLATRVEIVGETAAHVSLLGQSERLKAQLRVDSLAMGGVYVEDVRVRTRPLRSRASRGVPGDAFAQLSESLALRARQAGTEEQREDFIERLKAGLDAVPIELLREQLTEFPELMADAERLLVARLLAEDEPGP
jgi:DNA repair protein SbcD/Mre11